jgi:alkanesulfonate monooxygenase SsuD/methylene tetrahydromethanopterin reductase-like flavin-dependent oxidoreductase (luciferase family)
VAHARFIYISKSRAQAMEEMRAAVMFELDFQIRRGLFKFITSIYGWNISEDRVRLEDLVELDWYIVGSPDDVAEKIASLHKQSGGFGTLLMVTGKNWADREHRHASIRSFMENVAPQLSGLQPAA